VSQLHGAGKTIVTNFEDGSNDAMSGASGGQANAVFYLNAMADLRAPRGICGYASADQELHPGSGDWDVAVSYFRDGWSPLLRGAGFLAGAYGDNDFISYLLSINAIDLGWVTAAWSYGIRTRDSRAALFQSSFGASYDTDDITAEFYGGWMPYGAQQHPGPPPINPAQGGDMAYEVIRAPAGDVYTVSELSFQHVLTIGRWNALKASTLNTARSYPGQTRPVTNFERDELSRHAEINLHQMKAAS
jgi:hypothetical protein